MYICTCMYVCMYVCIYVCMYLCHKPCLRHLRRHCRGQLYVSCMYVCRYVCMYEYVVVRYPRELFAVENLIHLLWKRTMIPIPLTRCRTLIFNSIYIFTGVSLLIFITYHYTAGQKIIGSHTKTFVQKAVHIVCKIRNHQRNSQIGESLRKKGKTTY